MATGTLTIDLDAVAANWRALDAMSGGATQTAAVVKADGYGLGAARVARALAQAGARRFFVAMAEEGASLRQALGPGPQIALLGGHMAGDTDMIADLDLTPILNSIDQITRHLEALPRHSFGIHLDTGMNRLGLQPAEWEAVAPILLEAEPELLMSHLVSSEIPDDPLNLRQLALFRELTEGLGIPRSLANTGGVLLGSDYHFDLTRPGIGVYGGLPYEGALRTVSLALPVIQTRVIGPGESVGYNASFVAEAETVVATLGAGYADGLPRTLSNTGVVWDGDVPCPILGRVSMDLLTVDVTHLPEVPRVLDILGPHQTPDDLAEAAGTIGYEILTSLGHRHGRRYLGRAS